MGDVLLAAPVGLVLRAGLPSARIDWLVGPWATEVVRRASHADAIMTCDFPGFTRRPKRSAWEPYVELAREAGRLRRARYDAALVLRPDHWWGAVLAAAACIPHRIGFGVPECRPFLTHQLPFAGGEHSVELGLSLARLAAEVLAPGTSVGTAEPAFGVEADERRWVAGLLDEAGLAARSPLVAIHPGSGALLKNWATSRWSEVGEAIQQRTGGGVVLTGSREEAALLREAAARLDSPLVLNGRTSLGQLAALFERCDLVVGGDSGPLHLAAAVGTPTVRVYGPTDPAVFGPRGPARHRVVQVGLACQPCGNIVAPPCGAISGPACLREVSVESVLAEAMQALRPHPRAPSPKFGRGGWG